MSVVFDKRATKRPVNVSINSDLLAQARKLNINLSVTLEKELEQAVRLAQRDLWLVENKLAIEEYNRRIETKGLWSDGLRRF
ncbi:MAG: acetoacetyl-CoA synthase [Betaproteobacteria bacterium RBG_16_58_11]|nr:MAG: acetoacetyl-CoA synthase [Betaproteobacteria bacterium RBG_16_58_11]OFZ97404.1 MAG: acetoacetyl-CoA synthase [Betaproteobacteria bacterium RBG_19FT_COMBO_58_11]